MSCVINSLNVYKNLSVEDNLNIFKSVCDIPGDL